MRRFIIGIVLVAIVVTAAVLAARPWEGEKASGGLIEHRFCDMVFLAPPARQSNPPLVLGAEYTPEPKLDIVVLQAEGESRVVLDRTGSVIQEQYADTTARQSVAALLATRRSAHGPPQWWPYTDRTQYESTIGRDGVRYPDPGSGLTVVTTYGMGQYGYSIGIKLENCASEKEITWFSDTDAEEVTADDVQPEDQEAFDTFFASLGRWHRVFEEVNPNVN